ncbi:P-II family nitrogen regulator [Rhodoferax sp.]|uniref:P-II family nitrogen regulator n=1 Tax=Rhodoferax sp. TaxID=50421 RepID=UPI0039B8B1E6
MEMTARKLLTIVTEAALEDTLVRDIEALGAHGYTITDARGKGGRGKRDASWGPHANIRIEVLCDAKTADAICTAMHTRYYDDYSMVLYVVQVGVLRPEKF